MSIEFGGRRDLGGKRGEVGAEGAVGRDNRGPDRRPDCDRRANREGIADPNRRPDRRPDCDARAGREGSGNDHDRRPNKWAGELRAPLDIGPIVVDRRPHRDDRRPHRRQIPSEFSGLGGDELAGAAGDNRDSLAAQPKDPMAAELKRLESLIGLAYASSGGQRFWAELKELNRMRMDEVLRLAKEISDLGCRVDDFLQVFVTQGDHSFSKTLKLLRD